MKLIRLNEIHSVIISKNVVDNISQERKVFKFLKFLDEIQAVQDLWHEKKKSKNGLLVKYLTICVRICAFFHYLLDNIVWMTKIAEIKYMG